MVGRATVVMVWLAPKVPQDTKVGHGRKQTALGTVHVLSVCNCTQNKQLVVITDFPCCRRQDT